MNWDDTPWGVEASTMAEEQGIPPDKARTLVIIRWMEHGDLQPLAFAFEDGNVDKAVLDLLAEMIWDGRLIVKPSGRGRPHSLKADLRDMSAIDWYEHPNVAHLNSDDRYDFIAGMLRTSHQSVRRAVTAARKRRKRNAK